MTVISRDEYLKNIRNSEPGKERIRQLQAQTFEAVRATAVTGHPDWDHFLSAVEARIKAYREMAEVEQAKLNNPLIVNADEIMLLKVKLACLNEGRTALEGVIELPKALISQGLEASKRLHNISATDDSEKIGLTLP